MKMIVTLCVVMVCAWWVETAAAATATTSALLSPASIEERVREYFKDAPVMIEIARCESKFRHFTDGGSVLRGGVGGGMVGVFQFYEVVHAPGAVALGYNLHTLEGNLAYAKHVYDTQGTNPWNSSRSCWDILMSASSVTGDEHSVLLKKITLLRQIISLLLELRGISDTSQAF